jgi:hypothetical protein
MAQKLIDSVVGFLSDFHNLTGYPEHPSVWFGIRVTKAEPTDWPTQRRWSQ